LSDDDDQVDVGGIGTHLDEEDEDDDGLD